VTQTPNLGDLFQPKDLAAASQYEGYELSYDGMVLEKDAGYDDIDKVLKANISIPDCSICPSSSCQSVNLGGINTYKCDECGICNGISQPNRFKNCLGCNTTTETCILCTDTDKEYALCNKIKNECILSQYREENKQGCYLGEIPHNNGTYFNVNTLIDVLNSCMSESLMINMGNDFMKELCYFNSSSISYYDFERPSDFYLKKEYSYGPFSLDYSISGSDKKYHDLWWEDLIPFYKEGEETLEHYRIYVALDGPPNKKFTIQVGSYWYDAFLDRARDTWSCSLGEIETNSNGFGYKEFTEISDSCQGYTLEDIKNGPKLHPLNGIAIVGEADVTINKAYVSFYSNTPKSNGVWSNELRYSNCNFDTDIDTYLKDRPWWVSSDDNLYSSWYIVRGNPNSSIRVFYDSSMPGGEGILPGDVNHDGIIDANDLTYCTGRIGATPSSPNWDPLCDIDGDNVITLIDIVKISHLIGTVGIPSGIKGNIKIQLGKLDVDFQKNCKFDIYVCSQDAFAEYEGENILGLSDFLKDFNPINVYKTYDFGNEEIILYNYFDFILDKEYTVEEIKSAIKTGFRDWEQNLFPYLSSSTNFDWLKDNNGIYQGSWKSTTRSLIYENDCWDDSLNLIMKRLNGKFIIGNCQDNICKEKVKIRIAFKYKKPNNSTPQRDFLYPTVTFCDASNAPAAPPTPCSSYTLDTDCVFAGCRWCPSYGGIENGCGDASEGWWDPCVGSYCYTTAQCTNPTDPLPTCTWTDLWAGFCCGLIPCCCSATNTCTVPASMCY